mmetsp:Transcript_5377/g.19512  ORF Transcript_5377/g.19512 Transcript_5377/m.19512 type:complete len:251 (+) Transcript_5377:1030-1782(+)
MRRRNSAASTRRAHASTAGMACGTSCGLALSAMSSANNQALRQLVGAAAVALQQVRRVAQEARHLRRVPQVQHVQFAERFHQRCVERRGPSHGVRVGADLRHWSQRALHAVRGLRRKRIQPQILSQTLSDQRPVLVHRVAAAVQQRREASRCGAAESFVQNGAEGENVGCGGDAPLALTVHCDLRRRIRQTRPRRQQVQLGAVGGGPRLVVGALEKGRSGVETSVFHQLRQAKAGDAPVARLRQPNCLWA